MSLQLQISLIDFYIGYLLDRMDFCVSGQSGIVQEPPSAIVARQRFELVRTVISHVALWNQFKINAKVSHEN